MSDTAPGSGIAIERWARRRVIKIVLDVSLLAGFAAEFLTREGPDYDLHSWVGIVLIPIVSLHLISNLGWVKRVIARKRDDREFNLAVVNAVLGVLTFVCTVTGFPIWLEWSDAGLWVLLHTVTGFGCLIAALVHLWMNRSRLIKLVKR